MEVTKSVKQESRGFSHERFKTVGELINQLNTLDPSIEVTVCNESFYTWINGLTSFTSDKDQVESWDYAELAKPNPEWTIVKDKVSLVKIQS